MKSGKTKLLAQLLCVVLLLLAVNLYAFAAAPAFSSTDATYNVGTGSFVIAGTNLTEKTGTNNDLDLTKISITDGVDHTYTLSGKAEITSPTAATVTLTDKDKAALANILDKAGKTALNGGTYQVNVLAGWNGTTSTNDFSAHALTVSGVASINAANTTYDASTGVLVIDATGMSTVAATTKTDITPKYLYVTDGATKLYTLKTTGIIKIDDATSVTITLNAADRLALQSIFDKNGTSSEGAKNYYLRALAGWNGAGSVADMGNNAITVSNYAKPVVTTTQDSSVVYGGSITSKANTLTTSKPGTMYIVAATTPVDSGTDVADLEALVTAKEAVKGTVANGASVTVSTKGLDMTTDTADFKAIAVDLSGNLSSLSTNKITVNNVPAPVLTVTAAKASTTGTKLTVTAGSGNTIAYKVSTTSIATPKKLTVFSSGVTDNYAGTDITTVDPLTNKYLGIYELDSTHKLVKFKQIVITTSNCSLTGATAPTATLAVGGATPVGGVVNVGSPAANATDTTGSVTGWVASTANKIKFTIADNGSAHSTIKINGSTYTSGADYAIASTASLSVVVTTTETGKATGVRTYTISVAQAYAAAPTFTLAVGGTNPVGGVTNVARPNPGATDTTGAVTGWTTSTADTIKFTVADSAPATSTITIACGGGSAAAYTSGADYVIPSKANLTIIVTTTETGKATATRTFTVAVS